jgi:hypothetical protein
MLAPGLAAKARLRLIAPVEFRLVIYSLLSFTGTEQCKLSWRVEVNRYGTFVSNSEKKDYQGAT